MGRSPKLDDDRLELIRKAVRLGLPEREAAEVCGICERTWYKWKAKARAAARVLPEEWEQLKFEELLACAAELEIEVGSIRKTGRSRRLTRADLLRVLRERSHRYLAFLQELESAGAAGKLAILERLDDLANGRVKVRRTRTTQTVRYVQVPGAEAGVLEPRTVGDALVTTDVLELGPDRQVNLKMLAMRWPEEYGRRTNGAGAKDPEVAAKEVTARVHQMLTTVPPPPQAALPPAPEGTPGEGQK